TTSTTTTTTTTIRPTSTTSTTLPSDTAAPSVPTGLSASAASCSQVNLAWSAATDTGGSGLKGYNVYRGTSFVKLVPVPAIATADAALAASTVYSYTVSAVDNAGNEAGPSNTATTTTPACPDTTLPAVPAGPSGSATGGGQIDGSAPASAAT